MKSFLVACTCALATGLYLYFYLQGFRFFDNDYDWINQARATSWVSVLTDLMGPVPEDWGFQFRPGQVFVTKMLVALFGETAIAFYAFKCLTAGGVAACIAGFLLVAGESRQTAVLAAAVFGLSAATFASTMWISDFELVAQILTIAALGVFWFAHTSGKTAGMWKWAPQILAAILMILAHRTKGSAKILPVLIVAYLIVWRRDQLWQWLPAMGCVAITSVPLIGMIDNPVPPFAPFSEDRSQGWMWKPASLDTLWILLIGNVHVLFGTADGTVPYSLLANLTPWLALPCLVSAAIWLRSRERVPPHVGFLGIWMLGVLVAYTAYPRLPHGFMARYVVVSLVPASMLVSIALTRVSARYTHPNVAVAALAVLLLGHGSSQSEGHRYQRETLGQAIVAYDRAREAIASDIQDADVVILGFEYGYNRERIDTNRYHETKYSTLDPIQRRPLYVLVRSDQNVDHPDFNAGISEIQSAVSFKKPENKQLKVGIRPIAMYDGLTPSIYDRLIYRSRRSFVGLLYQVTYEPMAS